ncbi:MAG: arginine deiminase family protein [Candidatus ainarchaeum sp.]|nr:arginine deiminase family protein [Candidatus ainarchaeum sp.]
MKRKVFVTSLMHAQLKKRKRTIRNTNIERISVINQLVKLGKKVIIVVPKTIDQKQDIFLKQIKKTKNVKIMRIGERSPYQGPWQRDCFTRLGRRYYNKDISMSARAITPQYSQRYFGEGGRIINLGKIKGKQTLLISNTAKEGISIIKKEIKEEIEMLKRQGYNVFELPGHDFSPYGQKKPELKKRWFDHIDVFINTIPEKKLLIVDPDYLRKNRRIIENIVSETGFRLIIIPEKEKYTYPANLLSIGNGEIIMNSDAKKTINILRNVGVKVFASPKGIKANLTMRGGIGCFVNID